MTTHTIKITFSGICSHFQGVVPGVPHRVVLPNATGVHFGMVRTEDVSNVGSYYLLPHFPVVLLHSRSTVAEPKVELPSIGGAIAGGVIVSPARLQIANPADPAHPDHPEESELHYDKSYELVPPIREFVPNYQYSNEVVTGGRAAAYFDIFGGTVSASTGDGGAVNVVVEIHTDGPPELLVMPFATTGFSPKSHIHPIPEGLELKVVNSDVDPGNADTPYDFLLHYLTSRHGIPQIIHPNLPGLRGAETAGLPSTSHPEIVKALRGLADTIANNGQPTSDQVTALYNAADILNPSCSDTRYP